MRNGLPLCACRFVAISSLLGVPVPRTTREKNERYFQFFRRMRDWVSQHNAKEEIEGYVLWASSVDALAQIHARRSSGARGNRRRFVQALFDLASAHALDTISVPLLHHDLTLSKDPTAASVL